jgi:hypothetical protein
MRNKLLTRTSVKGFFIFLFKVFLWIILLSVVSLLTLLTLGYFGASRADSYLPEIHAKDLKLPPDDLHHYELKSPGYLLSVKENGGVTVRSTDGDTIMSGLTYYTSSEDSEEKWGMDDISVNLTSDSTISIAGEGQSGVHINILFTVPKGKPELDVKVNTHYSINTVVNRESLVAGFDVSVSEVYLKNRQLADNHFDSEYWLQREGARFGNGNRSALIYHTPFVSSLQLNTKGNLIFINLEYCLDHPFLNIPYQEDGGGRWVDLSAAKYSAGDERTNNFSIYFGTIPKTIPRLMQVPYGNLAAYVFTEHADGGNIRTHRAAYFGSEDITRAEDAVGGFVGHKIPVTKSVFYSDIKSNADSSKHFNGDRTQYLDFLDQLYHTGEYDICLHGSSSNRELFEESVKFMKDRFDEITWIDHGMFSGKSHRTSLVCDGLIQGSEYFVGDLWEKYGIRYFWNAAVEEIIKYPLKEKIIKLKLYEASVDLWKSYFSSKEINELRFYTAVKELVKRSHEKGETNSLLLNRGDGFPTPLYWQHHTRTNNFYSWATDFVKIFNRSETGIKDEQKRLNKQISDWGIFINHGYFVRNHYEDGVLSEHNGKIVIDPYFDKTLEIMATMGKEGNLYTTTIRNLLDYWILIENISFDYMPDGTIYINNLNDKSIKGFSLAIKADVVRIDGEIPKSRRAGDDTVIWFDIPARQRVKLQTNM